MSDQLVRFFDEVLLRYLGPEFDRTPHMRQAEVETLLTDDSRRRVHQARRVAADWGETEVGSDVEISSERLVITPHGLLYAAELSGTRLAPPRPRRGRAHPSSEVTGRPPTTAPVSPVYYLATTEASFEPIIDRVRAAPLRPDSAAAVDCRYGHDLEFPYPLDAALRRTLDSHPVLLGIWRASRAGERGESGQRARRTGSPAPRRSEELPWLN